MFTLYFAFGADIFLRRYLHSVFSRFKNTGKRFLIRFRWLVYASVIIVMRGRFNCTIKKHCIVCIAIFINSVTGQKIPLTWKKTWQGPSNCPPFSSVYIWIMLRSEPASLGSSLYVKMERWQLRLLGKLPDLQAKRMYVRSAIISFEDSTEPIVLSGNKKWTTVTGFYTIFTLKIIPLAPYSWSCFKL